MVVYLYCVRSRERAFAIEHGSYIHLLCGYLLHVLLSIINSVYPYQHEFCPIYKTVYVMGVIILFRFLFYILKSNILLFIFLH